MIPSHSRGSSVASYEKKDLQQELKEMRDIREVMLKERVMCWQGSLQPPRLDVRDCAHAQTTFLHTLTSLFLSFYLSLSLSFCLRQGCALPICLSHSRFLPLHHRLFPSIIGVYLSPHHATMTIPC